jgi:hypothetical protein
MSKMGSAFLEAEDFFDELFPDLLMDLIKDIGSSCINNNWQ